MAITRGNNTTPEYTATGATSISQSITCTSPSSGFGVLLVGVALDDTDNISSVTYNGTAMTQLKKQAMLGRGAGGGYSYVYGLVTPDTGASYTITATRASGSGRMFMGAVEYTGCSATIPDATGGTTPAAPFSSLATNITTVADNCVAFMFVLADNGSLAASTGTTQIAESAGAGGQMGMYETNPTPITPAGTKTLNITSAVDCNGGSVVVSLAPYTTEIEVDSIANSTASSASGLTYALNNVAGDLLVVGVCLNDATTARTTGITYNGVAMTQAVENNDDSPGSQTSTSIWYLANPATGSNNIIISTNTSGININSGAISFINSNTSSPLGATTTKNQANGTTCTQNLTTSYDNSIIVDVWGQSGTSSANVVTGTTQTSRWVNSTSRTAFGSNAYTTTAGSYTMAWSWTTSRITGGCLAEFRSVAATSVKDIIGSGFIPFAR